jgi:cyclopropane fatty-acyl-phospholipid synthase-like methyltransferase
MTARPRPRRGAGPMTWFDTAYEGTPTWDLPRPQAALVRLVHEGRIHGDVLDAGCGTGENALFLASRDHVVVGIDLAAVAVRRAEAKKRDRGVPAEFVVLDALRARELGRTFDTVLDVGLFHTLRDDERVPYAHAMAAVLRRGGRMVLLCWSERNAWGFGPRRITHMEIRGTFHEGWVVESIDDETYETSLEVEIHAWLATLRRC